MLYRLNFDEHIFAELILKIKIRANGGSENKALQAMVTEWNALEDDRNPSSSCQVPVKFLSSQADSDDQLIGALDDLDDAWGE